jgi:hypothetical protein
VTTPAPPPAPADRPFRFSRILLVAAAVMFALAALAAGGHAILLIPAWSWGFGAFAAWALSGAVP